MKNVLVPVDGSDCAGRAVRWVSSVLAGLSGARVHLAHVRPAVDAWEVRSHLGADDIATIQTAASAAVLTPAAAVVREAGLPVETHAAVGDVATEIAALVRTLSCDAIVMGTRGLGPVQSQLLRSTAMKVIHLADVPVTLLK